jgi:DNA-binding CsgD family transcriptional regulator/catechol 2,3-dioxygenase-like lactoylglutathione lyase family enzyme
MKNAKGRGRPRYDDVLTPAEWQIVHAVKHGLTSREIAARRGVSLDAVKYHLSNVTAKLNLAGRKALRQWFRAPRGSALSRQEISMQASTALGRIGQISRSVRDIEQSQHWYQHVLGFSHLYTFGTFAFFDCGGTRLALSQQQPLSPGESILYLSVEDIIKIYEDLMSRGVEFINAPHMVHKHADGTEEWMAFFKDSEGRPLAIMSQVKP